MAISTPAPSGGPAGTSDVALTISVVISTRNRGDLIAETLETLMRLTYPAMEIVVIDQSVDKATRQTVGRVTNGDHRVWYHASSTIGSSAGRNAGASLSRADIVAFTDDDCLVSDEWLEVIAAEFRRPDIAAVYGRLLPHGFAGRTGSDVGLKDSLARVEYSGRLPPWHVGHGGNMAFRRSDLMELGGFDPLLGAGGRLLSNEDGDISYRLLAAGKRIVYSPGALAYHKPWKPWLAQKTMERAYGIGAGAQFGKYIRCGDRYGWRLLATWVWQLGVRRLAAGLLKWRSWKPIYLGYCQLVYPWIGLWRARRYPVDPEHLLYVSRPVDRSLSLVARPPA